MNTDMLITYVSVVVIAAAVVFSIFVHAYKPSTGTLFTPTYEVLNQHIGEIMLMANFTGFTYGNGSAPIWVIYFVNPYDDANYTLANIFNETFMSMVDSGKVYLVVVPNPFTIYGATRNASKVANITYTFLSLYACTYKYNKQVSLEFLRWFSERIHENSTLALNMTAVQMLNELSSLGFNTSLINYTVCLREFNATEYMYSSFLQSVMSYAYGLQAPSSYVPPSDLVIVGINRLSNIAVVDENIAGYTPPLNILISNLMTQRPFYDNQS